LIHDKPETSYDTIQKYLRRFKVNQFRLLLKRFTQSQRLCVIRFR